MLLLAACLRVAASPCSAAWCTIGHAGDDDDDGRPSFKSAIIICDAPREPHWASLCAIPCVHESPLIASGQIGAHLPFGSRGPATGPSAARRLRRS